MTAIATVFFDAVGTLIRVRGSVGQHYAQVAQAWGVASNPVELDAAFRQVYRCTPALVFREDADYANQEREWWQRLVWQTFSKIDAIPNNFDAYFAAVYDHFATAAAWELYPETRAVLEVLHSRYRLGVISNFDARLLSVLAALDIADYFDTVTLSGQVGVSKPQAAIFEQALAGAAANTALHVGDSLSADYEGAIAAGLEALWLNRQQHSSTVPGLRDLSGVIAWL